MMCKSSDVLLQHVLVIWSDVRLQLQVLKDGPAISQ